MSGFQRLSGPAAEPVSSFSRFQNRMIEHGLSVATTREIFYLSSEHYCEMCSGYGLNSLPPEDLWENILPAARQYEKLRSVMMAEHAARVFVSHAFASEGFCGITNLHIEHSRFSVLKVRAIKLSSDGGKLIPIWDVTKAAWEAGVFAMPCPQKSCVTLTGAVASGPLLPGDRENARQYYEAHRAGYVGIERKTGNEPASNRDKPKSEENEH